MSAQKNRFEYTMLLVIFGCGILIETIVWVNALMDEDYLLMVFASILALVSTVFFQKVYRKYALVEHSDLQGKDDDRWRDEDDC